MITRVLAIGLFMSACGGAAPAVPASSAAKRQLQTKVPPPAVGDVVTLSRHRTLDAMVNGQEHHERLVFERTTRILAVVDGDVSKVETSYASYVQEARQSGPFEPIQPHLGGHTYVISLTDPPTVTREDGAEVTGYELGVVLAANPTTSEPLQDVLATRSWPLGGPITLAEAQRAQVGNGASGSATITLTELTDSLATLELVDVQREIDSLPGQVLSGHTVIHVDPATGFLLDDKIRGEIAGAWTGHMIEENKWTFTPAAK